jgi:KipI family sensor histidine kinase inhibitor
MTISDAGDAALLLELEAVIDRDVNRRAIAIARAVTDRQIPGVRDVIAAYRSIAVHFDPLTTDVTALANGMREAAGAPSVAELERLVEVPVVYGGEEGPDLPDVAAFAGLPEHTVIDRHAGEEYRVFMLGFLPGYAYMGLVHESIAMPRRPAPRVRVPAGSVGIAGRQTGIYPRQSPGGWQLIGRTNVRIFDPARAAASLFAQGDRVRYVPMRRDGLWSADPGSSVSRVPTASAAADASERVVTVVEPGLFTTVQDLGRWGHQHLGVPVSGPMDFVSHRLANALVGNEPDAATLEATVLGPELRFETEALVGVTGADLDATLDGTRVPLNTPCGCRPGTVLRFGRRRSGGRAYVACDGGIDVPHVLGSRATHVLSGLGGVEGRALVAGDHLRLGERRDPSSALATDEKPGAAGGVRLRVMRGPHDAFFDTAAFDALQRTRFTISPQSNRMGYRLSGPQIGRPPGDMISDAAFIGGVQVPPSGEPILLMADRQTTGGYPLIATVITADLPIAGQLVPGDSVEFEFCTRRDAIAALIEVEDRLRAVH